MSFVSKTFALIWCSVVFLGGYPGRASPSQDQDQEQPSQAVTPPHENHLSTDCALCQSCEECARFYQKPRKIKKKRGTTAPIPCPNFGIDLSKLEAKLPSITEEDPTPAQEILPVVETTTPLQEIYTRMATSQQQDCPFIWMPIEQMRLVLCQADIMSLCTLARTSRLLRYLSLEYLDAAVVPLQKSFDLDALSPLQAAYCLVHPALLERAFKHMLGRLKSDKSSLKSFGSLGYLPAQHLLIKDQLKDLSEAIPCYLSRMPFTEHGLNKEAEQLWLYLEKLEAQPTLDPESRLQYHQLILKTLQDPFNSLNQFLVPRWKDAEHFIDALLLSEATHPVVFDWAAQERLGDEAYWENQPEVRIEALNLISHPQHEFSSQLRRTAFDLCRALSVKEHPRNLAYSRDASFCFPDAAVRLDAYQHCLKETRAKGVVEAMQFLEVVLLFYEKDFQNRLWVAKETIDLILKNLSVVFFLSDTPVKLLPETMALSQHGGITFNLRPQHQEHVYSEKAKEDFIATLLKSPDAVYRKAAIWVFLGKNPYDEVVRGLKTPDAFIHRLAFQSGLDIKLYVLEYCLQQSLGQWGWTENDLWRKISTDPSSSVQKLAAQKILWNRFESDFEKLLPCYLDFLKAPRKG